VHFDNPIFIFLVIVAALLRWLSKRSETTDDEPERPIIPDQPIPRNDDSQSEEERIRRFLEALGQPPGTKPPAKVTPKRPRQVKPRVLPTLPPLTTAPPSEATEPYAPTDMPPPLPSEPERVFLPTTLREPTFEVRDLRQQATKGSLTPSRPAALGQPGFVLKLDSAQDLRNAIILREVLGPPLGLTGNGGLLPPT